MSFNPEETPSPEPTPFVLRNHIDWERLELLRDSTPALLAQTESPNKRNPAIICGFNERFGGIAQKLWPVSEEETDAPEPTPEPTPEPIPIPKKTIWVIRENVSRRKVRPPLKMDAYELLKRLGALAFVHGIEGAEEFFQIKKGSVWPLKKEETVNPHKAATLLRHFTGPNAISISSIYGQTDAAIQIIQQSLIT